MKYYDAVTVKPNITQVKVSSLDSNTKYLMRVTSRNNYGSETTEPMEIKTIGKCLILPLVCECGCHGRRRSPGPHNLRSL